jgi:hypothetical protein
MDGAESLSNLAHVLGNSSPVRKIDLLEQDAAPPMIVRQQGIDKLRAGAAADGNIVALFG